MLSFSLDDLLFGVNVFWVKNYYTPRSSVFHFTRSRNHRRRRTEVGGQKIPHSEISIPHWKNLKPNISVFRVMV